MWEMRKNIWRNVQVRVRSFRYEYTQVLGPLVRPLIAPQNLRQTWFKHQIHGSIGHTSVASHLEREVTATLLYQTQVLHTTEKGPERRQTNSFPFYSNTNHFQKWLTYIFRSFNAATVLCFNRRDCKEERYQTLWFQRSSNDTVLMLKLNACRPCRFLPLTRSEKHTVFLYVSVFCPNLSLWETVIQGAGHHTCPRFP